MEELRVDGRRQQYPKMKTQVSQKMKGAPHGYYSRNLCKTCLGKVIRVYPKCSEIQKMFRVTKNFINFEIY